MNVRAPRVVRAVALVLFAATIVSAVQAALPHGGGYLNPPGFVPKKRGPSNEANGPSRPGGLPPPGPSVPSAPTTPSPRSPSGPGPAGGPRTGGGIVLAVDPTRWQDWWELNRDPFLRVREALRAPGAMTGSDEFYMGAGRVRAVDTLAPSQAMVRGDVAPRLRSLLESTTDRDLETACLVALAKVGQDRADFELVPLFEERLRALDQEVRETAALTLGLSGAPAAVSLLVGLVLDDQVGRRAVARTRVEWRVRAFAAYGLAVWARGRDAAARRTAFAALEQLLDAERADRDVKVAAILGIGILGPDTSNARDRRLRAEALERLRVEWDLDAGPAREMIRCHAATSIARLLDGAGDSALAAFHADRLTRVVADRDAGDDLRRAAALAVGHIVGSGAVDSEVATRARDALRGAYRTATDKQTRYFALIALGRAGGDDARAFLLNVLATGQRALERPWAAVALGVLAHGQRDIHVDSTVAMALRAQLAGVKNPDARAACAIGLGLCGEETSADELRDLLADVESQDELAGHVCVGLALLRDARAIPALRALVESSGRRPQRLREAAVALGALGDRDAAEQLVRGLRDGRPSLAQVASISVGLGLIGDRRSLEPLLALASDEGAPDLSRAFAIVAVGKIVERGDLPWATPLAVGLNYRAAVETLIDGFRGILDVH